MFQDHIAVVRVVSLMLPVCSSVQLVIIHVLPVRHLLVIALLVRQQGHSKIHHRHVHSQTVITMLDLLLVSLVTTVVQLALTGQSV